MSQHTYLVKGAVRSVISEGARAGQVAVHVNFSGCNLWSGKPKDREESEGECGKWCHADFAHGHPLETKELLTAMDSCWPQTSNNEERWCWLTGGEPMLQVDAPLMQSLKEAGWMIAIETNGTQDPTYKADNVPRSVLADADWVCFSPKLGSKPAIYIANELKVHLPGCAPPDPGWTDEILEAVGDEGQYEHKYVAPADPIDPKNLTDSYLINLSHDKAKQGVFALHVQRCMGFVDRHPDWKVTIPVNKFLGVS